MLSNTNTISDAVAAPTQQAAAPLVTPKFEMAKGGSVAETRNLRKEGGMMDEGGTKDPISGNAVPIGAMKEEVRDDVPAQLSEGEFVIPADVVRYIGLERLMMMRQAAKEGLKKMEEMGQMSNAEEATLEDDGEFESEIDDILSELDSEKEDEGEEEVKMAEGGSVRAKVGEPTGEMSEAGRPLYKTADGETVSEKSITVPFAGEWVNVPSIHDGVRYEDDEIEDMLAEGKIKPTSTHKTMDEAVTAAKARSSGLIKPKMAEGGVVDPAMAQTQEALAQDQQPAVPAPSGAPALTEDQLSAINITAEKMKQQQFELPPEKQSKPTEGLSSADIIREDASKNKDPAKVEQFLTKVQKLVQANKVMVLRHNDTVTVGFIKPNGAIDPLVFTKDTPDRIAEAAEATLFAAKKAGIKRIESNANADTNVAIFNKLGYPAKKEDPKTGMSWSLDLEQLKQESEITWIYRS